LDHAANQYHGFRMMKVFESVKSGTPANR